MKIIHTADWHLGQSFYGYDRKTEHIRFLSWLKDMIRKHGIDVLLIAGDVFDNPNPSAESQKIYYSFLREITDGNPRLQVIIIAGNHDSAARLEAPNPLLEGMNVSVRGLVKRLEDGSVDYENLIIPLMNGGYCLAVPYLRQGDYPEAETYSKSVKSLYDSLFRIANDKTGRPAGQKNVTPLSASGLFSETEMTGLKSSSLPVIAIGHLHATGSEISENDRSERTVIGGLECVSPDAFSEGIAYTALGHLHRGQRVHGKENIRYAGAPIPMSFAEKNNTQGVVLVEINEQTNRIERIVYDDTVELMSIPREHKRLDDVLAEMNRLPDGEITDSSPYLEIKILITEPEPSLRSRIEETLKGKAVRLARISAVTPADKKEGNILTPDELHEISPLALAEKVFVQQYGGDKMPEPIRKLLQEIIREVER